MSDFVSSRPLSVPNQLEISPGPDAIFRVNSIREKIWREGVGTSLRLEHIPVDIGQSYGEHGLKALEGHIEILDDREGIQRIGIVHPATLVWYGVNRYRCQSGTELLIRPRIEPQPAPLPTGVAPTEAFWDTSQLRFDT